MSEIGVVVIGRNEGRRLARCLESISGGGAAIVYVDSGSTDGSPALARGKGADVVDLDMSMPFSAARSRNTGFARLLEIAPRVKFIQFVDGDCELSPGWLAAARRALEGDSKLAIVCGRLRERHPDHSIYNRLCDHEWNQPPGITQWVGGIFLIRREALQQSGGFNPSLVAGEEPELCSRLRAAGWRLLRITDEMAWHDAAMTRFSQWWKRNVRNGYWASDAERRFKLGIFTRMLRSSAIWSLGWLAALLAACLFVHYRPGQLAVMLIFLAWPAQVARMTLRSIRSGDSAAFAFHYSLLTMIVKWAILQGRIQWWIDGRAGERRRLIEYKAPAHSSDART